MAFFDPNKPSDISIVDLLASRLLVEPCVIVAWLKQFDGRKVTEELAERFTPKDYQ